MEKLPSYWIIAVSDTSQFLCQHIADGSRAAGLGQPVSSCRESETHAPRPASASKPVRRLLDGVSSRRVRKSERAGAGTARPRKRRTTTRRGDEAVPAPFLTTSRPHDEPDVIA